MDTCDWCTLSDDEKEWLLIQNGNWSVYLADQQDYIGRCILVLNRHCGCLSELTDSEWMDLKHIIERLETCVFNISMKSLVIITIRKREMSKQPYTVKGGLTNFIEWERLNSKEDSADDKNH